MSDLWQWILIHTGTVIQNGTSVWYNFWSGFGSDLGEITLIAGAFVMYKRHNCPVQFCPRLSNHHHPVAGTPLHTCRVHDTKEWHDQLAVEYAADYPHREQS